MSVEHAPHPTIHKRKVSGPHLIEKEHIGFNGRLAIIITNGVGTMWCAYIFTILALISLPDALKGGTGPLVSWVAQTFLQLVLLSVIMVGQKVAAQASDKQALQTYEDAETLLQIQDELHKLMKINNAMTSEIHQILMKTGAAGVGASPAVQA